MKVYEISSGILGRKQRKEYKSTPIVKKYEDYLSEASKELYLKSGVGHIIYKGKLSYITDCDDLNPKGVEKVSRDLYLITEPELYSNLFTLTNYNGFCITSKEEATRADFITFRPKSDILYKLIYGEVGIDKEYDPRLINSLYEEIPTGFPCKTLDHNGFPKEYAVYSIEELIFILCKSSRFATKIKSGFKVHEALCSVYSSYTSDQIEIMLPLYNRTGIYIDRVIQSWSKPKAIGECNGNDVLEVLAICDTTVSPADIINTLKFKKKEIMETCAKLISNEIIRGDLIPLYLDLVDLSVRGNTVVIKLESKEEGFWNRKV